MTNIVANGKGIEAELQQKLARVTNLTHWIGRYLGFATGSGSWGSNGWASQI